MVQRCCKAVLYLLIIVVVLAGKVRDSGYGCSLMAHALRAACRGLPVLCV